MSNIFVKVGDDIKIGVTDIGHFLAAVIKAQELIKDDYPGVKQAISIIIKDTIQISADLGPAIASKGININMDSAVWSDLQRFIADAKSGVPLAEKICKDLGITL